MTQPTPTAHQNKNPHWNWHPDTPLPFSPLFTFPPNPVAIARWFSRAWLPITELTVYLLLGVAVWLWLQPPLAETQTLSAQWIGPLWLRNMVFHASLATALHCWLYTWQRQGDAYRYMSASPTAQSKQFLGGSQLKDNIFCTLASGVTIWTLYESLMWVAMSRGIAPTITFSEHPIWFVLWFPLIGIWYSFHFYWIHRFLHWKPLYVRFHAVHHRNITTGPWSGFSMHPVEHIFYLSSLFIHLVVPSHPVHMLFHAY